MEEALWTVPCSLLVGSEDMHPEFDPACEFARAAAAEEATYTSVRSGAVGFKTLCRRLEGAVGPGQTLAGRVFFLAIPPSAYGSTLAGIRAACPHTGDTAFTRFVLEKPFGTDGPSADALLSVVLDEAPAGEEVFLVDHYLGKAALHALPALRACAGGALAAGAAPPALHSVHAGLLEAVDVQGRTWFYQGIGALRDVLQNHATEMALAMLAPLPQAAAGVDASGMATTPSSLGSAMPAAAVRAGTVWQLACGSGLAQDAERCAGAGHAAAPVAARRVTYDATEPEAQHLDAAWFHSPLAGPCTAAVLPDCGRWSDAGAHVTAGEYVEYDAHVATQQGAHAPADAAGELPFTPTAARAVLRVQRAAAAPPLTLAFTGGKALVHKRSFVRGDFHHANGTGAVEAVLAGPLALPSLHLQGPALVLRGPLPPLAGLPSGWRVAHTCSAASCASHAPPRTAHGAGSGVDPACGQGLPALPAGTTVVLLPATASRHRVQLDVAALPSSLPPTALATGMGGAYLAQQGLDVSAAGKGALGGVQAYTNVLAAAIAGDAAWFVDLVQELPALWALWDPLVAAAESQPSAA